LTALSLVPILIIGQNVKQAISGGVRGLMKPSLKSLGLLAFCVFLAMPGHAEDKKTFWYRFSLKFTAGWGSRIPIGDVNDVLKSFNNNKVFEFHRQHETGRVVGQIKTLDDRISHWEAELRFDLTRRISLGIATSAPIHKHNESSVTYTIVGWAGPQIMTWTFRPEIKVSYPIRLSAYYSLPIIHGLSISVGAGAGIYPAKISLPVKYDEIPPSGGYYSGLSSSDAKRALALGFHGNVVLEYFVAHKLAFVAEFQQRSIRIRGLKGTYTAKDGYVDIKTRGTLYYFSMWNPLIAARHNNLEVWERIPFASDVDIHDAREAMLNLNGYSIRLGIRLRVF